MNFNHLKEVDETYFQHFRFAFPMALRLLWGGFCLAIHSVLPFIFVDNGTKTIRESNRLVNERFPERATVKRQVHSR